MRHFLSLRVAKLSRGTKQAILISLDAVTLTLAMWLSFMLRLGPGTLPATVDEIAVLATAPIIAIPIFIRMGLYRAVIRYLPERAIWTVLQAMTLTVLVWVTLIFLIELTGRTDVPRSVPVLFWALGIFFVGGSRFLAKKLIWPAPLSERRQHPIVIYGAGESGAHLATSMRTKGRDFVVGFLDDNKVLHGRDVAGHRVYAPNMLPYLIGHYGVREVILSVPSATPARRQEILATVSDHGVKIRTLPPISDFVSGKYLINQVREIDIDELLGRSSVPAERGLIEEMVAGRTIMVTGAGGSIGSELCRLITRSAPQRLVLFEANEFALYQIEQELSAFRDLVLVSVLGSVVDSDLVREAITMNGVNVVLHAAAHKHVPIVEANVLEGIRNNVLGTLNVATQAFENGVESFVLISSDKAVRPTNVMGATKRWSELIVHEKARQARAMNRPQRFSAVRFGNVLGSNGSVVPLFRTQIARGGPVTLTDAAMTRYFMSIHEAAELIVQAGALSEGGDVFLLDMGEPILIADLAENMVKLAGLTVRSDSNPQGDIEIAVTGKRPGEKMYEELFYDETSATATRHPKILRAMREDDKADDIAAQIELLRDKLDSRDEAGARRLLFDVVIRSS